MDPDKSPPCVWGLDGSVLIKSRWYYYADEQLLFLAQELPSTCRLGLHPVNLQWCNSNLTSLSALLVVMEQQRPYVRRRPTQSVILISLAPSCLTTLLMEQETAAVCGCEKATQWQAVSFTGTLKEHAVKKYYNQERPADFSTVVYSYCTVRPYNEFRNVFGYIEINIEIETLKRTELINQLSLYIPLYIFIAMP